MTQKRAWLSLVTLVVLATSANSAQAKSAYLHISGTQCWSNDAAILVNQFGIYNNSTTDIKRVWCPVNYRYLTSDGQNPNVFVPSQLVSTIVAYDRNSSSNVVCTYTFTNGDASSQFPCTSNVTSGISAASQTVTATCNTNSQHYVSLFCDLPPATASGVSVLSSVKINYAQPNSP